MVRLMCRCCRTYWQSMGSAVDAMKVMWGWRTVPMPENGALFIETVNRDDWGCAAAAGRMRLCPARNARHSGAGDCLLVGFLLVRYASAGALAGYRCRPSARCSRWQLTIRNISRVKSAGSRKVVGRDESRPHWPNGLSMGVRGASSV